MIKINNAYKFRIGDRIMVNHKICSNEELMNVYKIGDRITISKIDHEENLIWVGDEPYKKFAINADEIELEKCSILALKSNENGKLNVQTIFIGTYNECLYHRTYLRENNMYSDCALSFEDYVPAFLEM